MASRNKDNHNEHNDRTRAREQALQLLFTGDFVSDEENAPANVSAVMDDVVLEDYTYDLYRGVLDHRRHIDKVIEGASENWSISRMANTDRAILQIAVFELIYKSDIPAGVAINEAVELAQHFGGEDDSYRFVNGVLGRIAKQIENGEVTDQDEPEPVASDADDADNAYESVDDGLYGAAAAGDAEGTASGSTAPESAVSGNDVSENADDELPSAFDDELPEEFADFGADIAWESESEDNSADAESAASNEVADALNGVDAAADADDAQDASRE